MFFTSGILIAFFCFAFYLIWNQFLKKDTRLSTGLQLLRKKINELENLSVTVSSQMERQMSLARDKVEDLELLLKSAKENSEHLEKLIQTAQTLGGQAPLQSREQAPLQSREQAPLQSREQAPLQSREQSPLQSREQALSQMEEPRPVPKPKTPLQPKPQKEQSLQFGESPFTGMDTGMDFLDGSP